MKRFKRLAKWFGYTTAGITILVITLLLVAYGQGYFYSPETGRVSGGLFFIVSEPANARITIDGDYRGTTTRRVRMPVGEYLIELTRDSYRPWSKRLPIEETRVTHVHYPLLVPNTVSTVPVAEVGTVDHVVQSPSRRYIAVTETDGRGRVLVFDLNNDTANSVFTVPRQLSGSVIGDVLWSPDSSQIMVTIATEEGNRQFLVNPRDQDEVVDVTDLVGMSIDKPVFAASAQRLYGVTNNTTLRQFDLRTGSNTVIARDITDFSVYDDQVFAVRADSVGYALLRVDGESLIELLALEGSRKVSVAEYDDQIYAVLHDKTARQATIVSGSEADNLTTISLPIGIAGKITISPSGRFVAMHTDRHFMTYDLERSERHHFSLPATPVDPQWYGNYHFLSVISGDVFIFEFDGGNLETLTQADNLPVYGYAREAAIYSIVTNELTNRPELQKSLLK